MPSVSPSFADYARAWYMAYQASQSHANAPSSAATPANTVPALSQAPSPAPVVAPPLDPAPSLPIDSVTPPTPAPPVLLEPSPALPEVTEVAVALHHREQHRAAPADALPARITLRQLMQSPASAASESSIAAAIASHAHRAPAAGSALPAAASFEKTEVAPVVAATTPRSRAEVIAQAAYKVVAKVGDRQSDVLTLLKA